jgi:hypothetical protein
MGGETKMPLPTAKNYPKLASRPVGKKVQLDEALYAAL